MDDTIVTLSSVVGATPRSQFVAAVQSVLAALFFQVSELEGKIQYPPDPGASSLFVPSKLVKAVMLKDAEASTLSCTVTYWTLAAAGLINHWLGELVLSSCKLFRAAPRIVRVPATVCVNPAANLTIFPGTVLVRFQKEVDPKTCAVPTLVS